MRKLDTSTLGPIKVEPRNVDLRARIVRDALKSLHMDDRITVEEHWSIGALLRVASDDTLARLGRMLR